MSAIPAFNWAQPDYAPTLNDRLHRLQALSDPAVVHAAKLYYRDHPADFINDFGVTYDPRVKPSTRPFLLFPRQREWLDWTLARWRAGEPGLTLKSRDCGCSWLIVAFACWACIFHEGTAIGIGSAKEDKVDRSGDPDCLFWKARSFLEHLPPALRGGHDPDRDSAHMRLQFPATGASTTGEAGDQIGRGGRKSIYFIDEAAFLERPELIDAALSATTNVRIDVSTPNGMANPFARRWHSGRLPRFQFSWRDDPRKDDAWYQRQKDALDASIVAREIDCDFLGSTDNQLLPAAWVQAAIDAHKRLGIRPTGMRFGALDVADQGSDLNAFASRVGILVDHIKTWSGQTSNLYATTVRAINVAASLGLDQFSYDAIGIGSACRGDAEVINGQRAAVGQPTVLAEPFVASGAVPNGYLIDGRANEDAFLNLRAWTWWALRTRFRATYEALQGHPYEPDELISLSADLPELTALVAELSQIQFSINATGKIVIDKAPDGAASPNRGDALMMCFGPVSMSLEMWLRLGR